jgi:hypothetical protein
MVAALLLGAGLRLVDLLPGRVPTPDERTYTAQANTLAHEGLAGLRRVTHAYLTAPTRFLPPPSRIGYTGPIATVMAVTGRIDTSIGAWISGAASCAGLVLIALIATHFFGPWVGAIATFLLATFPPDLVIARRAWTDAWAACLTYGMLYCAVRLGRGERSRWLVVETLVFTSLLVMTKETAAIVCGLSLLWIIGSQGWASVRIVAAIAAIGCATLAFMAWTVGGIPVFWDIQTGYTSFHLANLYDIDYQSGPAHWLLVELWIMSPGTTALGLIGLLAAPFTGAWRQRDAAVAVAGLVLAIVALPLLFPGWLNLRYSSPAFGPLCILAGAGCMLICNEIQARLRPSAVAVVAALAGLGLIALGARDYRYFNHWFIAEQTADLSVRMVFETSKGAPTLPPLHAAVPALEARDQSATDALNQSLAFYRQGRFDDSIAAARLALTYKPDYAEAYNNIAAALAVKGSWDEALPAARKAVQLDPDFQLAKNNLAWILAEIEQRRREASAKPFAQ